MLIKHGVTYPLTVSGQEHGCGCILTLPMPEVPSFVQSSVPCWTALRYILDNTNDNNIDNNNNSYIAPYSVDIHEVAVLGVRYFTLCCCLFRFD